MEIILETKVFVQLFVNFFFVFWGLQTQGIGCLFSLYKNIFIALLTSCGSAWHEQTEDFKTT